MTREEVEKEIGFGLSAILQDTHNSIRIEESVVLYSSADELSPNVIVEIGAYMGTSSTLLGSVAKKHGGKLYSIERRPRPEWYENMKKYGVSSFTELISVISPHLSKEHLPFDCIDYLFIDADHSYENVLGDYRFWQTMVRPGGRIAFHDYFSVEGTKRAVTEILRTNGLKFVALANGTEMGHKLGLIIFEKVSEDKL